MQISGIYISRNTKEMSVKVYFKFVSDVTISCYDTSTLLYEYRVHRDIFFVDVNSSPSATRSHPQKYLSIRVHKKISLDVPDIHTIKLTKRSNSDWFPS